MLCGLYVFGGEININPKFTDETDMRKIFIYLTQGNENFSHQRFRQVKNNKIY